VSASKRTVTVSRAYRPDPDYCIRALAMLLEKPVKEAVELAPEPDGRDGTKVQGDDSADARIIPE
jgi:hypothetical protein